VAIPGLGVRKKNAQLARIHVNSKSTRRPLRGATQNQIERSTISDQWSRDVKIVAASFGNLMVKHFSATDREDQFLCVQLRRGYIRSKIQFTPITGISTGTR
jgi:hypothetical protein